MGLRSYFVNKLLASWDKSDQARFSNKLFPEGVHQQRDVYYAQGDSRNSLDVYYPSVGSQKLPVLIDIHGGGFMSGDKESDRLFCFHMVKRGFLVFNLNYRLALSDVKVTDQIQDIALATEWVRDHLEEYNGSRNEIFICGHSAGAVLAAIEALTAQSPRLRKVFDINGHSFVPYKGIVLDCGMMTFYQHGIGYWGMRTMVFHKGYRRDIKYNNMIWNQIAELSTLPKTFLISNEKDELRHMTRAFKRILDEKTIENHLNYQTNDALGHMEIIYNPDSIGCSNIIDDMVAYLRSEKEFEQGVRASL
ncbi:MAG: alpha/beta hydrolase [Oscillospiraceae bacterium]|jgi:acetyl esterase/lipase|nr:alpha/beta hydrolase [Oscillospiraceae bacterium]